MKLYGIESSLNYYGKQYRWYSKYNGARGGWVDDKEEAAKEGEDHQRIIESIYLSVRENLKIEHFEGDK